MVIILSVLATALMLLWLMLLFQAREEDWVQAAYNTVLDHLDEIAKLERKDRKNARILARYHGVAGRVMRLFLGSSEKQIAKRKEDNVRLQKGNLKSVGILAIPGYVLQRRVDAIGKGSFNKSIYALYAELDGKKYAANRTRRLLAQMISCVILGVALALAAGSILMSAGNENGPIILLIGVALALVLAYVPYNDVKDKVTRRRAAISRQFPNVVSKLALLVTSGMIMDRAWKETAYSQEGELYLEMRKVSEELANLVEPAAAYANFMDRCSTKETMMLATAMIQNLSKGNAEIGRLLKGMAHEAWQERQHSARRDSEKANSRLMIPTMLLFLAILIMIVVPVITNFNGL
nr:type II secretion system F family protein [Clostridium sp. D33t1_170424_F3]